MNYPSTTPHRDHHFAWGFVFPPARERSFLKYVNPHERKARRTENMIPAAWRLLWEVPLRWAAETAQVWDKVWVVVWAEPSAKVWVNPLEPVKAEKSG